MPTALNQSIVRLPATLCLAIATLLMLSACVSNKVSPATLALQNKLELRELALEEQVLAADRQRAELDALAVELDAQKKENVRTEKRLKSLKRSLNSKKAKASPTSNKVVNTSALIVGAQERVKLLPPGLLIDARMDTGARRSMISVYDLTEFERDGEPHVRFKLVAKKGGDKVEVARAIRDRARTRTVSSNGKKRPVVKLRVKLGELEESIEFVLVEDNDATTSDVNIGRNFLRDLAVVDVSKKNLVKGKK